MRVRCAAIATDSNLRGMSVKERNGIPAPRLFVQSLPPPAQAPFLIINDYTPSTDREEILNELANEGASTREVRRFARWALTRLVLELQREPTDLEIAQALLDLEHQLVHYADDPVDHEEYSRPLTTLRPVPGNPISPVTNEPKGRGDCDDMAVLFAALGRAVGLQVNVVWVDQRSADYNHIAAVACFDGEDACHWVETTIQGARIGETTSQVLRRVHVEGRADLAPQQASQQAPANYVPAAAGALDTPSSGRMESERVAALFRPVELMSRGTCPECGRGTRGTLDPQQAGPKPKGASWYNFRCPCGFSGDYAT